MAQEIRGKADGDALKARLAEIAGGTTLGERIRPVQARARAAGLGPDGADDKALMDDLSGGM